MAVDNNENIEKFVFNKEHKQNSLDLAKKTAKKATKDRIAVKASEKKAPVKKATKDFKATMKPGPAKYFDKEAEASGKGKRFLHSFAHRTVGHPEYERKTREEILAERIPLFEKTEKGKKLLKMYEDTKPYFSDIDNYNKCVLNKLMASAHVNFHSRITDKYLTFIKKVYKTSIFLFLLSLNKK